MVAITSSGNISMFKDDFMEIISNSEQTILILKRNARYVKIEKSNVIMASNGKAFSSQIKRMSKKPLKYNPEEVMVIKVDMTQDMFNFAMDVARECMGKFKKEDEPGMANHTVNKFNEEFGEHWMSVVGDNYGVDVTHQGNFAHFHMGSKDFVIYKAA